MEFHTNLHSAVIKRGTVAPRAATISLFIRHKFISRWSVLVQRFLRVGGIGATL